MSFTGWLANYCLFRHTWAAMASMVLLRMSPSWPCSNSILIQHPSSAMLTGDTLVGFPCCRLGLAWLSLACLDFSVDPKSQILRTCKSTQIRITSKNNTNSTWIMYTAIHIVTFKENPGGRVDLASWLRISLSQTIRICYRAGCGYALWASVQSLVVCHGPGHRFLCTAQNHMKFPWNLAAFWIGIVG